MNEIQAVNVQPQSKPSRLKAPRRFQDPLLENPVTIAPVPIYV